MNYNKDNSAEDFIALCRNRGCNGIIISDDLKETIREFKPHVEIFGTCCGQGFREVVEIIASVHEFDEHVSIVGFENDHTNTIDTFPNLSAYRNINISFALCDCIAEKRRIVNHTIVIEAEKYATIYSHDYSGINFSYNLPHEQFEVSCKTSMEVLRGRKQLNLNVPHAVASYSYLYERTHGLAYTSTVLFYNTLVQTVFNSFEKAWVTFFAFAFVLKYRDADVYGTLYDQFRFAEEYGCMNIQRFLQNDTDIIGRVLHMETESDYMKKLRSIETVIRSINDELNNPLLPSFIESNGLTIDLNDCRNKASYLMKIFSSI